MITNLGISGCPMIKMKYSQIEIGNRSIFASDIKAILCLLKISIDCFLDNIESINKYK